MARKDEEKRKRRQHRQEKKLKRREARNALAQVRHSLEDYSAFGDPATFPGACDDTIARPDLVKADFMAFAIDRYPGKAKFETLERDLRRGLLHYLPDIDDWAMEEFGWHGLPGDPWQPIDEYLRLPGLPLSPAAHAQIALWKQARIGMFEVGEVNDDTVWLREWDALGQQPVGEAFRAITLNISGVHVYKRKRGDVLLTHVSPWDPDRNIGCGMGYGVVVPKNEAIVLHEFLGLRHLALVSRPLAWLTGRESERKWLREWRQRDWLGWFAERVQFPFEAFVPTPPKGFPRLATVRGLLPSTPADAERFGVYFEVDRGSREAMACGGTTVTPVDVTSPNRLAFAEYKAYRDIAGPPPGVRGQPTFMELGTGNR